MDILMRADELGIETGFFDAFGTWRCADPAVLAAVIEAVGEMAPGESLPDRDIEPAFSGAFDRVWVLAVQLYSLRSPDNWGVGDFSDLRRLIAWAADKGAAGIGLNPLHALFEDSSADCSPYAPSSRLFLNTLYIDVAAVPELPRDFLRDRADVIARLRERETIAYAGVAVLKRDALHAAFAAFRRDPHPDRLAAFEQFRCDRGVLLARFAAFNVLRRVYARPWWEWPPEWRMPDDVRISALRRGEQSEAMEAIEFAQWCAHEQLSACGKVAAELGQPLGLYLDLAVGVRPDGFDAWNEQEAISHRLSVGAPPDLLNTGGQNWGLAGFSAGGLVRRAFEPFREMLRAAMRYAGAVRIDHVLGLKRLYLIPQGFTADKGVYVRMPFEALLAVLAEESRAHRCIVIGEDLGTVPDGFRERLAASGVWLYRVMMFERDHTGSFYDIGHYPPNTLVTFGTHDLATYTGWSSGHDIVLKQGLGIDPGESIEARTAAVAKVAELLQRHEIDHCDIFAAIAFLARTRSRILAIMIEDLLNVIDQPNIPGTIDEHPNWRRKLPVPIEQFASAIDMARLRQATGSRDIRGGSA